MVENAKLLSMSHVENYLGRSFSAVENVVSDWLALSGMADKIKKNPSLSRHLHSPDISSISQLRLMFSDLYWNQPFKTLENRDRTLTLLILVNLKLEIEIHHVTWKVPEDRRCM